MRKTAILTDTGSAMTPAEGKELGIYVLPLQIVEGEKGYEDLIDINTQQVWDKIREGVELKTSSPVYSKIEDMIKLIQKDGYEAIIYVPLTPGISSTASTTYTIATSRGIDISIIDCFTTVYLQKYIAMKAKELVDSGKDYEEVVSILNDHITRSNTYIVVPDLTTLKRGGRVTPAAAALAGMLKIVPLLVMNSTTGGKIDTYKKIRTTKKAVKTMVEEVMTEVPNKEEYMYSIVDCDSEELAEHCKELLMEEGVKEEQIHISLMNSVISVHTGLGVLGLQYIEGIKA